MAKVESVEEYRRRTGLLNPVEAYRKRTLENVTDYLKRNSKDIPIGHDAESGERTFLNLDLFKTHVHVIGRTGTGKTRFLAILAQQLLQRKIGGCVIDIQGGLYHLIENYVAHHPALAERVVFFNPGEAQDPIVSFNPLKTAHYIPEPHTLVDMMIEAIMKHMGQAGQAMPTFKYTATHIFRMLVEGQLTLLESELLTDWGDVSIRKQMMESFPDPRIQQFWRRFDKELARDKKIDLLAFVNRMNEFTWFKMLRYTLGRTNHTLDFKEIVDNDKLLLVNLRYPLHLSFDAATLIGILLIHELFYYAMSRSEEDARRHPFVLMIDEMQNFLTPDLARILDQCRQKGLHLVLAHQRLQQLQNDDPNLYSAVRDNARTKVVFGVSMADAELLAPEIFKLDLLKIKHELYRTAVLDYKLEYHTVRSETSGTGMTSGSSNMSGSTQAHVDGTTWPTPYVLGGTLQASDARAIMESYGSIDATSTTEATTESEVPMLQPVLGQELAGVTFYSPEELRYLASWGLKEQPVAYATIKRANDEVPQVVKMQALYEWPYDEEKVRVALERSVAAQPTYYLSQVETHKEIEARHQLLGLPEPKQEQPQEITTANWFEVVDESAPPTAAPEIAQPVRKKRKKE